MTILTNQIRKTVFFIILGCFCTTLPGQTDFYSLTKDIAALERTAQIAQYKKVAVVPPGDRDAFLKIVQLAWLEKEADDLVSWLLQDFGDNSVQLNARYALLWVYLYQKDIQKALALVDSRFDREQRFALLVEFARLFTEEKMTQQIRYMLQNEFSPQEYALLTGFINFHNREFDRFLRGVSKDDGSFILADLIGRAYLGLGETGRATRIFQTSLNRAESENDLIQVARFLTRLAKAAASKGDYAAANDFLEGAETNIVFVYDLRLLADYYAVTGLVKYNMGEQEESIKATEEAITIAESLRDNYYLIELYYNLGRACTLSEQYQKAFSAYNKSESLAMEINNLDKLFLVQLSQASLLYNLSLYSLAEIFSQDALQLALMTENPNNIRVARGRAAGIQFGKGQYRKAVTLTKQLLAAGVVLPPVEEAYWNNMIGRSYMFLAQYDSARIYLERALENIRQAPQRSYYEGYYLENLVDLEIERKNFAAARELVDANDINMENRRDSDLVVGHLLNSGIIYEQQGDLERAATTLKRGLALAETSQGGLSIAEFKIGYLSKVHYLYDALARVYFKQYQTTGAKAMLDSLFYYEELSRSRVLKEVLGGANNAPQERGPGYHEACRQLTEKQQFVRNTSTMNRESEEWIDILADLEFSRINLLQQKLLNQPRNQQQSRTVSVPDLSGVRGRCRQDDLGILIYHIDGYSNYVLAIQGDTTLALPLDVEPVALRAAVDSLMSPFFRLTGASSKRTQFRAGVAHRLYQKLILPLEEKVKLPTSLLIVPGYNLAGLPFEMLLTGTTTKSAYLPDENPEYAGFFLLNKYSIFYSPTSLALTLPPLKRQTRSLVVFANPFTTTEVDYDPELQLRERTGWSLMPLPYAEKEADEIERLYKKADIYTQEAATEAQFKKVVNDYDILHIASHAFVDTMFDDFSGLVLAVGEPASDDGILMGYEIKDLRINCDLVALSACETGRGGKIQGEGILGMPRLFLGAGARSVLMSLWKVDDRFTSLLIPMFYDYFLNQGFSKAVALTMAKRQLLNEKSPYRGLYYQHPMFWASFAIYGEPGTARDSGLPAWLYGAVSGLAVILLLYFFRRKIFSMISR